MKHTTTMKRLLERMAAIEGMERGKLCQMTGRPHYNHQTWRNGRNEVRYVPKAEVAELKKDIAGYQLFTKLAEYQRTHPGADVRVRQKPFSSEEIEQLRALGYGEEGDHEIPNPGHDASAPPHRPKP